MRLLFKQSVHLCGQDYKKGTHDVGDDVMKDPYFKRLVAAGLILDADEVKIVSPLSAEQKQEKLIKKLVELSPAPPEVVVIKAEEPKVEAKAEVLEEPALEEPVEEFPEVKEAPSRKKKKR